MGFRALLFVFWACLVATPLDALQEKSDSKKQVKLSVRVVDSSGVPLANASAVIQDVAAYSEFNEVGTIAKSDEDGLLESEWLLAKRAYRLVIQHDDFQAAISRSSHLLDEGEVTLQDVVMPGWRTVSGVVLNAKGEPIPDVTVFQKGTSSKPVSAITNQAGQFTLDGFPEQAAILFFEHADYWFTGKVIVAGADDNAEYRLSPRTQPNTETWDREQIYDPPAEDWQKMRDFMDDALQRADQEVSAMSPEHLEKLKKQQMGPFFLRQLGQLDPKFSRLFIVNDRTSFYAVLYDINMRHIDRKLAWIATEENVQQKVNGLNQVSQMVNSNQIGVDQADWTEDEQAFVQKQIAHAALTMIPEARVTDSVENAINFQAILAEVLNNNGEPEVAARLMNSTVALLSDYQGAAAEPLRFGVAEYLTRMGMVDQAIELAKPLKQKMFKAMLSYEVVKVSPEKAYELVKDFEFKLNQGSRISATHGLPILCYHAAKQDVELALRFADIVDKCPVRGVVSPPVADDASEEEVARAKALPRTLLKAKLHAFIAAQIAETDPDRSRDLFASSIETIAAAKYAVKNPRANFTIAPISYMMSIVNDVARLDPGTAAETVWRAMSIRLEQNLLSPPWDQQNNFLFPLAMLNQLDANAFELAQPALQNMQKLTYSGMAMGTGVAYFPLDASIKIQHALAHCDRSAGPATISPKTNACVDLAVTFKQQLDQDGKKKTTVGELVTAFIHSSMWIHVRPD